MTLWERYVVTFEQLMEVAIQSLSEREPDDDLTLGALHGIAGMLGANVAVIGVNMDLLGPLYEAEPWKKHFQALAVLDIAVAASVTHAKSFAVIYKVADWAASCDDAGVWKAASKAAVKFLSNTSAEEMKDYSEVHAALIESEIDKWAHDDRTGFSAAAEQIREAYK